MSFRFVAVISLIAGCLMASCATGGENSAPGGETATAKAQARGDAGSDGGTSADPSAEAGDAERLREAVYAYSTAFLSGDAPTAWNLLSERCQELTARPDFSRIVEATEGLYVEHGAPMQILTYEASVETTMARVSYTFTADEISQRGEPWVYEQGAWHNDDC